MKFIENRVLIEANLVCAFARADKILNDEESSREDLLQSRAFLMEMFGKLERITAGLQDKDEGRDTQGITENIFFISFQLHWIMTSTGDPLIIPV